jgi:hypothetical protein
MHIEQLGESLQTQRERCAAPVGTEVILRVAGRDYAIRGVYADTSSIIIEAGEEVTADGISQGRMSMPPGGPEGEGVEPAPPVEIQAKMHERRRR